MVMKMANIIMMASIVVKEAGTKVAQFMGYNNLKLNRYKCNKWNTFEAWYFWDSTTGFGKSLSFTYGGFCDLIQVPTCDTE